MRTGSHTAMHLHPHRSLTLTLGVETLRFFRLETLQVVAHLDRSGQRLVVRVGGGVNEMVQVSQENGYLANTHIAAVANVLHRPIILMAAQVRNAHP